MGTNLALPLSLADNLSPGVEELRLPATFENFVAWTTYVDYPIEYEDGEIVIMSIASDEHERIVANILGLQFMNLKGNTDYGRYGSNRHVFIQSWYKAYAPDASVVKGAAAPYTYAPGKAAYTNPWLVVEVTSPTSQGRDFGEKLQGYKAIDSLEYILYVAQDRPLVTLFERIPNTDRWQSIDYNALNHSLTFGPCTVTLADVYDSIDFA
ncbi:MAG: Uma2 family endonuclease [Bacteroidota bacterium]